MPKKVSIDNLADEITRTMKEYTEDVSIGIEKEMDNKANEAVKQLRATSPRSKKIGRHYADGWTKKKDGSSRIVHNKKKPGLAHLLEHGHAKRGGERVSGIPHIRPVEQSTIKEFEQTIEQIIRKGGK